MQHEPCSSHDAICAVLAAIRESVREMRDMGLREQAKMTMWQNLGVALIGAIGGGILAWVSKQ